MKAIKITFGALVILMVMSCETHYRMVTTLEHSGKVHREVYAYKLFDVSERKTIQHSGTTLCSYHIIGGSSRNPFFFNPTPDWEVIYFDTVIKYDFFGAERQFNVKVHKDANSIDKYSQEIQYDDYMQSFAVPEESLLKKFKWFYTYYSFKTVYKQIAYELPVPIGNYLDKEELILWTQGGMSNQKLMNGCEMYNYLNEINDKFLEWYSRNCFEISWESIKEFTKGYDLDTNKENIYTDFQQAKTKIFEIEPKNVCAVLDSFYKTNYFSQLYESHNIQLENNFRKISTDKAEIIGNVISYELVIPAKVLQTNAPIVNSDILIWKVDGMRLLFDDYTLTAEYRIANKWAFIITGFIVIIAIGSIIILAKKRRFLA